MVLEANEFVFVVQGEKADRVVFKKTFTVYEDALEEYNLRCKSTPRDVLVSIQKVEKFFRKLDIPA